MFSLFISASRLLAFEISSDDMSIDTKNNTCILTGNAEVKINDNVFKADKLIIKGDIKSEKPESIEAFGNINFSKGKDISVKCDECKSDMKHIYFYKNISIVEKNIGEITADSAKYDIQAKKIDITSKKKVKLTINKKLEKKINNKKLYK
jgi:lipopolysaccharide transport protein LptA